jgi:small-conductance mechanosensitive channel
MTWIRRLAALAVLLLAVALGALPSHAQAPQPAATPAPAETLPDVAQLRSEFERLPETAAGADAVRTLQGRYGALIASANKVIAARTGQLNDLNARLGELGPAPAAGASEDPDITRQRQTLTRDRNGVDADVRLARLVVVDAQQRSDDLRNRQRDLFEAQLTGRAPSPLGGEFWQQLADAWPDDQARLWPLLDELQAAVQRMGAPGHIGPVLLALVLAVLAMTVGDLAAEHGLARLAQRLLPGGRLRRSLLVIAIVTVNLVVVALAMRGLLHTLRTHAAFGPLSSKLVALADDSVLFIAFVTGLGRALLANRRPSWRLPRIPDALALRLNPYPWLFALVGVLVWIPTQISEIVGASLAAVHLVQTVTALALALLILGALLRLHGPQAAAPVPDGETTTPAEPQRPLWVGLVMGAVALSVVGVIVLTVAGYMTIGSLLAAQLAWTGLVGVTFYVLFKFADDLCMAVVASKSDFGQRLQRGFGFAPATLDQAAVVLSALARLVLFFYMVIALLAPLGTRPDEVLEQTGRIGSGLKIGEFQLVPAALFSAIAVLVGGFVALRVFQRWLRERYLPTTTMEPGMQSSLATLLNYVGVVLVVAAGLSALGIGVNRIAWIASALSVGIGFGLQAIVQNFISGLILLAERPVKVGDWVVLGTTEGDIKRINVRATEIQLGDRSTVIVPNSEFITKTVRNMTLSNAEGRVLIRLPMPLATDAPKVREIMLAACAAHPKVLPAPAPSLSLEGVETGMLVFQAICYVDGPRNAGGVRSDLLFAMLDAFRQAGVEMAAPPTVVMPPLPPAPA